MALVRPVKGPLGRTDMGVDIGVTPGDPVVAIAPSRMIGIIRDWFQGQPFGWFQILSGPYTGKYWYAAEQIDFSARPGQTFAEGQRIGTIARSGTNTEFGWATRSGRTLAAATTGYTEGQVTRAGRSFRAALMGATAPGDLAWQPCTLTWYDPASGPASLEGGGTTASGEPYRANAFTCAAPSRFPFGTRITFRYRKRMVTCKVNDRGGAITGDHFDLSHIAASRLGIIQAGIVRAEYSQVGAGRQAPPAGGITRPGGGGAADESGQGLEALYQSFLDEGKAGDTALASFTTASSKSKARTILTDFSIPLPGIGTLPIPDIPILPQFNPFDLFKQGTQAIKTTGDLLKLIGWLLNPRNILRVVEFLVGLSLVYVAVRINMRVFEDAVAERVGRRRGRGGRGKRGRGGKSGRGKSGRSGRNERGSRGERGEPTGNRDPRTGELHAKRNGKPSTASKVKKIAITVAKAAPK